jgi:esterase
MGYHENQHAYENSLSRRPASQYVTAGTLKIHYLEWEGDGEYTVVLLHGIGDNATIWSPLAESLPRDIRIIAFDQRGHGNSDRPNPPAYACDDYVGDLDRCIGALGLNNIIVAGHSMGALHGTAYASLRPSRVAGLIHADIEPCPPEWNKKYLTNMYHNAPATYPSVDAYALEMQKNSPHADPRLLRNIAAGAVERKPDGAYICRYDREVLSHFDRYDVRSCLGSIACPSLVVRGSESRVMRRQAAEEMSRAIPDGRFVEIPKAAHPVHTDNPGEFHQAVLYFLRDIGVIGGE